MALVKAVAAIIRLFVVEAEEDANRASLEEILDNGE